VCQSHPQAAAANGNVHQRRRRYRRPASASIRLRTGLAAFIYSHQLGVDEAATAVFATPCPTMLSAPRKPPAGRPQYRQSLIWVYFARGYAAGDRVEMGHASRSRHVIWVLFSSTACSPRHFRRRETKHPGIVGPQETLLSRRHEGLVHPHRYCRRPQADHVFELRDAVSLNFDLLFTPLQICSNLRLRRTASS
jgi:hypothetical protein